MKTEGFKFDWIKILQNNNRYTINFYYDNKDEAVFKSDTWSLLPMKLSIESIGPKFYLDISPPIYGSVMYLTLHKINTNDNEYEIYLTIGNMTFSRRFSFDTNPIGFHIWTVDQHWISKDRAKELKEIYKQKDNATAPSPTFQEMNTQILQSLGSRICVLLDFEEDEEATTLMKQFRKHYDWYKQHEATQEETTERNDENLMDKTFC